MGDRLTSRPEAVLEYIGPGAGLIVLLANGEPVEPPRRRGGDVVTTLKNTVDNVVTRISRHHLEYEAKRLGYL